jgi:hypothetical protein
MPAVLRHKRDSKSFEMETVAEQSNSINVKVAWFTKAADAHARKIGTRAYGKIAAQLRRAADRIEAKGKPKTVDCEIVQR